MDRHAVGHGRARRATVVIAACAALAAGLSPSFPASASEAPQETVVPATLRGYNTTGSMLSPSTHGGHDGAGAQGVFHRVEGSSTLWWAPFDGGKPVRVPVRTGATPQGTGTDVVAYRYADRVEFWDAAEGTERTLRLPDGLAYLTSYDNLALAFRTVTAEDGTTKHEMHLLTPEPDGNVRDVTVDGGPAGLRLLTPLGADARSVFFRASLDGEMRMAAVDRETGQVQGYTQPLPVGYSGLVISPDHIVALSYDKAAVLVVPRADLSAAPAAITLAGTGDGPNATHDVAVVGDWLVSGSSQVRAQPIDGGDPVTLMPSSASGLAVGPGGTAVKIGRTGTDDWGVQRIRAGADGRPVVSMVRALPKPPYRIQGLSLDQGRLVVTDYGTSDGDNGGRVGRVRAVAPSGTPEFGAASPFLDSSMLIQHCAAGNVTCASIHGTADGRIAWLEHDASAYPDRIRVFGPPKQPYWERSVADTGRITDVSGRYLVYTGTAHQYVYRIGSAGAAAVTRAPGAAALSGDTLWTPAASPGTLTAYDLSAKKTTGTVTTGAGCTPTDLQALGRWLYWTCDGRAGVYDRTTARSVPVPPDEAELGDGYVVTHDKQAGKLVLTTVGEGTPVSRVVGDLPDTGVSQRDVRWTVDESGANAAYVDDHEQVHLVPSGVAQQPLRLLAPAERTGTVTAREPDTTPDTLTTLLLSKPAAGWRLTVRSTATGRTVDTASGGTTRGELTVGWSGVTRDARGLATRLPNGSYDWSLSVDPADGVGQALEYKGTVRLQDGSPVRHDHVGRGASPDGIADLLTLSASGSLTFQQGTGKGTFSGRSSGSGWSVKAVAVPFGDLNHDRCNDVLVRMADGSLRGYTVPCGQPLTTSAKYKKLGPGWSAYNVLTSPGDLTGDGRSDLLARKASTGDVYLFAAKSDGSLAAAKKIRSAWTGYKKIVGAGDLDGDGIGDVLAQDKAGTLYRYSGRGNGLLKDRVKLFSGWGGSYNAVVGVGDITGDGRNDLVARDTSGNLYRNDGNGKGSFGSRTKIGSGWQGYKGLF
ncbi:FG-GAP repeat domain-containing protein [Streptomyces sp. NPDC014684]|uniref:FG-GAP repeat domain-containing protein n=1 Tax=Streptomyces sp. NPDC014684 TaxID=3364880 RepID=UPI0036F7DD44